MLFIHNGKIMQIVNYCHKHFVMQIVIHYNSFK
ncbi:hypothetical protein GCAAIG_02505 [Candidatus Electronema halotolerans]